MKVRLIFGSIICLTIGSLIYLLFRIDSIKLFVWLDYIGLTESSQALRTRTLKLSPLLPDWFLYSLPDGLWTASYVCMMLLIWKNKLDKISVVWIFIPPLLMTLSEVAQLYNWLPGTFDLNDVLFYLSGIILPLVLIQFSINPKPKNHEII